MSEGQLSADQDVSLISDAAGTTVGFSISHVPLKNDVQKCSFLVEMHQEIPFKSQLADRLEGGRPLGHDSGHCERHVFGLQCRCVPEGRVFEAFADRVIPGVIEEVFRAPRRDGRFCCGVSRQSRAQMVKSRHADSR